MGKHSKPKRRMFNPINLLSRRRAILTILFTALMVLFILHNWIILSILFGTMAIIELFLAVETAGAEGAVGKEQEMAMASYLAATNDSSHPLNSLFKLHNTSKEDNDIDKKLSASSSFDGYL